jgi:hypothetical protein
LADVLKRGVGVGARYSYTIYLINILDCAGLVSGAGALVGHFIALVGQILGHKDFFRAAFQGDRLVCQAVLFDNLYDPVAGKRHLLKGVRPFARAEGREHLIVIPGHLRAQLLKAEAGRYKAVRAAFAGQYHALIAAGASGNGYVTAADIAYGIRIPRTQRSNAVFFHSLLHSG